MREGIYVAALSRVPAGLEVRGGGGDSSPDFDHVSSGGKHDSAFDFEFETDNAPHV